MSLGDEPGRATGGAAFKLGQRVRMTAAGKEQGLQGRGGDTGTVVGFGRTYLSVKVLRDGLKHPSSYHIRFWKPWRAR